MWELSSGGYHCLGIAVALYHFAYKHASRAKGHSAKAHADYIGREGKYGSGTYREQFVHAEHQNMPTWAREEPRAFWQAADTHERANGRLYTEMELALPRELETPKQIELVRDFVEDHIGKRHPVSWAIHTTHALDGGDNPHVHIMFSARTHDGIEREADQFFKRANSKTPERGGAIKDPIWEKKDTLESLREKWAMTTNRTLEREGHEPTLDHRSLQAQGIERDPEPHLGREQTAMLRRGEVTEQGAKVIELRAYRERLGRVEREIGEVRGQIIDLQQARTERQARSASPDPKQVAKNPVLDASRQRDEPLDAQRPPSPHESKQTEPDRVLNDPRQPDQTSRVQRPRLESVPSLSWKQRLEQVLPNDLPTLESLWQSASARRFVAVQDKARQVADKAQGQLERHWEKQQTHRDTEPQPPTGLLSRFQQKRYQRDMTQWKAREKQLHWRWLQLDKRVKDIADYGRKGFSHFPSKGEQLAAKRTRQERPELARQLEQAQAEAREQQQERRRQELRQRRQQEQARSRKGPSLER